MRELDPSLAAILGLVKPAWWVNRPGGGRVSPCRVMAVAEGYVMARHKGCVPFLMHWDAFIAAYEPPGGGTA